MSEERASTERTLTVQRIPSKEAEPWILKRHYANRLPCVQFAFGLFDDTTCVGVVTYGQMASPAPTRGVCGKEFANIVLELNRLCVGSDAKNASSQLVGKSLRMLPKPSIIMSYADTSQGHVGYIYQATNWIYTGMSSKARDPIMLGRESKHNRHAHESSSEIIGYKERPRKHRYVFFTGTRKEQNKMIESLGYPICPYPKGDTKRYDASANIETQGLLF